MITAYRCTCGEGFNIKEEFRKHFYGCPDAQEFIKETNKIILEYERLQKLYANPEDYT